MSDRLGRSQSSATRAKSRNEVRTQLLYRFSNEWGSCHAPPLSDQMLTRSEFGGLESKGGALCQARSSPASSQVILACSGWELSVVPMEEDLASLVYPARGWLLSLEKDAWRSQVWLAYPSSVAIPSTVKRRVGSWATRSQNQVELSLYSWDVCSCRVLSPVRIAPQRLRWATSRNALRLFPRWARPIVGLWGLWFPSEWPECVRSHLTSANPTLCHQAQSDALWLSTSLAQGSLLSRVTQPSQSFDW